jgi:hypothetical protein
MCPAKLNRRDSPPRRRFEPPSMALLAAICAEFAIEFNLKSESLTRNICSVDLFCVSFSLLAFLPIASHAED